MVDSTRPADATLEAALARSEARFQVLIDRDPDGIVVVGRDGLVRYGNPAAGRLLGCPPAALVGQPFGFPLVAGDTTEIDVPLCGGGPGIAEMRVVDTEWHSETVLLAALRDVTERHRAQAALERLNLELEQRVRDRTAQLEAANRELEAFGRSVSHDLRAPLRIIEGFSAAIVELDGDRLSARGRTSLDAVRRAARRMGELIDDLLTLSRVTLQTIRHQPVDLSALARTIAAELRELEPARAVTFVIAAGLRVQADAVLMRILLENLLRNAWKFTSQQARARIEVGMDLRNGEAVFYVRDDGAGFDPAHAHRLFQPFQRLHSEAEFEGTGIGLATVHRIVLRHGGRVWATGVPGGGATFELTIPTEPVPD